MITLVSHWHRRNVLWKQCLGLCPQVPLLWKRFHLERNRSMTKGRFRELIDIYWENQVQRECIVMFIVWIKCRCCIMKQTRRSGDKHHVAWLCVRKIEPCKCLKPNLVCVQKPVFSSLSLSCVFHTFLNLALVWTFTCLHTYRSSSVHNTDCP